MLVSEQDLRDMYRAHDPVVQAGRLKQLATSIRIA